MNAIAEPISPLEVKDLLSALLSTDPTIFLEHYGSKMKTGELSEFEVLKDDYPIRRRDCTWLQQMTITLHTWIGLFMMGNIL
jgi:pyruvate/2-oxoglutarate/acetoin dehydrogenase E1 component